ncbi:hypothetical protein KDK82_1525 [Delftia sp. K82]|nr:hypothetical protein KDK82_1525 [Delftia sp. K82]
MLQISLKPIYGEPIYKAQSSIPADFLAQILEVQIWLTYALRKQTLEMRYLMKIQYFQKIFNLLALHFKRIMNFRKSFLTISLHPPDEVIHHAIILSYEYVRILWTHGKGR